MVVWGASCCGGDVVVVIVKNGELVLLSSESLLPSSNCAEMRISSTLMSVDDCELLGCDICDGGGGGGGGALFLGYKWPPIGEVMIGWCC